MGLNDYIKENNNSVGAYIDDSTQIDEKRLYRDTMHTKKNSPLVIVMGVCLAISLVGVAWLLYLNNEWNNDYANLTHRYNQLYNEYNKEKQSGVSAYKMRRATTTFGSWTYYNDFDTGGNALVVTKGSISDLNLYIGHSYATVYSTVADPNVCELIWGTGYGYNIPYTIKARNEGITTITFTNSFNHEEIRLLVIVTDYSY